MNILLSVQNFGHRNPHNTKCHAVYSFLLLFTSPDQLHPVNFVYNGIIRWLQNSPAMLNY